MANYVSDIALVDGPLDLDLPVDTPNSGAVVVFFGIVRPMEGGKPILALDYEAHREMALHQLRTVAEAAIRKFDIVGVHLHHRIGRVPAGETSLVLRVTAAHRGAAFDASKWIVDELKKCVPIWKTAVLLGTPRFSQEKGVALSR